MRDIPLVFGQQDNHVPLFDMDIVPHAISFGLPINDFSYVQQVNCFSQNDGLITNFLALPYLNIKLYNNAVDD